MRFQTKEMNSLHTNKSWAEATDTKLVSADFTLEGFQFPFIQGCRFKEYLTFCNKGKISVLFIFMLSANFHYKLMLFLKMDLKEYMAF